MRVQTIIRNIHFGLRPTETVTHFRARSAAGRLGAGPQYTSQTATAQGNVIQRDYRDRTEWTEHKAHARGQDSKAARATRKAGRMLMRILRILLMILGWYVLFALILAA